MCPSRLRSSCSFLLVSAPPCPFLLLHTHVCPLLLTFPSLPPLPPVTNFTFRPCDPGKVPCDPEPHLNQHMTMRRHVTDPVTLGAVLKHVT